MGSRVAGRLRPRSRLTPGGDRIESVNGHSFSRRRKLTWAVNREILQGNAFGYTAASRNLMDALSRRSDVDLADEGGEDDWVVHFCHPKNFHPENYPGRRNAIFTMYEMHPPPPYYSQSFKKADLVVTPSTYCAKLFKPLVGKVPLAVSRLGYDSERFSFHEGRQPPEEGVEPFRWLWLGAANERKGYKILMVAWALDPKPDHGKTNAGLVGADGKPMFSTLEPHPDPAFKDRRDVCLLMKTTRWQDGGDERTFSVDNVCYDERRLSRDDLAGLYDGAHAFVFPSYGEGWGLTALEALATGLPVVTIDYSGMRDFLDEKHGAAFCGYSEVELDVDRDEDGFGKAFAMRPDVWDLRAKMNDVMRNYPAYLKRAKRGARRAAEQFTWDHAAESLVDVLGRAEGGR